MTTTHENTGNDTGYTAREIAEMAASADLDRARFIDGDDEVLHRVGDAVDTLFPDSDTLEAAGVDIVALNEARKNGLDMTAFGKAIGNGMELGFFSEMLERTGVEETNNALALFNDHAADVAETPDPIDRVLAIHGE